MDDRNNFPRVGFYIRQPTRDQVNEVRDMLAELTGRTTSQDDAVWWMTNKLKPELERALSERQRLLEPVSINSPDMVGVK